MPDRDTKVILTDVTLREYGQNLPSQSLQFFQPQVRVSIAQALIRAGFHDIEVLSCINPKIAPAMNLDSLSKVSKGLGRIEGVNLITLVPNKAGYKTFRALGLGPDNYNHTLAVFFSVIEVHNFANLGRTISDTVREYKALLRDAKVNRIRTIAYLSAVFGFRPSAGAQVLNADLDEATSYLDQLFDLGVETVTLTDLQGVASEDETRNIVEEILEKTKGRFIDKLGYHPHHVSHEEALAHTRAAYSLGLRRFDGALGGIGGCITGAPGNQPTEKLVALFNRLYADTGIRAKEVSALAEEVSLKVYKNIPTLTSL